MPTAEDSSENHPLKKVNSARRLKILLRELRSKDGTNLFTVLPTTLGFSKPLHVVDQSWAAMQAFTLVGGMIKDLEREIIETLIGEYQGFYQQCLPGICEALSPLTCSLPWRDIRQKITDVDLTHLEHVDVMLRQRGAELELPSSEFQELSSCVEQALILVKSSNLADEVRDFVAGQLISVKLAIEHYKYRGMRGIREALAGYCGSLAMSAPSIKEGVNPEERQKLWDG